MRFTFSADESGYLIQNTFHYELVEDTAWVPGGININDLLDQVDTKWTTLYRAVLPTSYTLGRILAVQRLQDADTNVPDGGEKAIGLAGTLTVTDTLVPHEVCQVVNLHTDTRSRSARGWLMLPPSRSSTYMQAGGDYAASGGYHNAVVALMAILDDNIQHTLAGVNDYHLRPVVYSHKRHNASTPPWTFTIKSATKKNQPHWLRTRTSVP